MEQAGCWCYTAEKDKASLRESSATAESVMCEVLQPTPIFRVDNQRDFRGIAHWPACTDVLSR